MHAVEFPQKALLFHNIHSNCTYRQNFQQIPKKTVFSTHANWLGHNLYHIGQNIMLPWRWSTRLLGQAITLFPGKMIVPFLGKNQLSSFAQSLLKVIFRIALFVAFMFMLPIGILCLSVAVPIHYISFKFRHFIACIDTSQSVPSKIAESELDLRTYNVAFIYEAMRIVGNLRSPVTRAEEIAKSFLQEKNGPAVICFQEAFHVEATKRLCEKLKEKYPYIIHSLDPHFFGLNSGSVIMSQYPIEEVSFRRFTNMLGPENLSTRGLVGIRLDLGNNRYANIYNTHLQSLLGKKRADIRKKQLESIVKWIDEDHNNDQILRKDRKKVGDFLMGDLNLSHINAWGYHNAPEEEGKAFIEKHFYNPFYEEHNDKGERVKGKPRFLDRSKFPNLIEPSGTWYTGPFANKGLGLRLKEWYEKKFNHFTQGTMIKKLENPVLWGKKEWTHGPRTANTAHFDFQLLRKRGVQDVTEFAEVEHVDTTAPSGPSDHLPVRAIYRI